MLLITTFLEKNNNLTVSQAFINAYVFWPNNKQFERLVVLDQASYMMKAFENFKLNFRNLNHITYLVHCLNRVCELSEINSMKLIL